MMGVRGGSCRGAPQPSSPRRTIAVVGCGRLGALRRVTRPIGFAALALAAALTALPAPPAQALDTTAGYTEIQRAFLREAFEEVTSLAQTFILQYPDAPEVPRVWVWLALSLDRLGEPSEALRELDRLKTLLPAKDPVWSECLFWEGDISRRALQMDRARSAYQRLLARFPDATWASQARLGLGLIELHEDAFEAAIEQFHAVSSQERETPAALDAMLFEGLCHLQVKRYGEAVALLTPLLSQLGDPDAVAQAAFYLGEALTAQGRYQDAAGAYQRAIDSSTTPQWSRPALFGLGWAHYQANRCGEGVAAFERYLAEARIGHRTEALFAQASCLMRLERPEEAVARFEQILSRDPDHPLAVESGLVIADAYQRQERDAQAKALLHGFLRRGLDDEVRAQVQLRLAAIALAQGNPAQARTIYTLAAERPEPPIRQAALSGLGDVALFLGELTVAQARYEQAIAVADRSPMSAYARYQVGRIQLQLGAFEAAIDLFQRLTAGEDPALADDARLALVIAYLNHDQPEAARRLLGTLRAHRPGSVLAARAAYYEALLALGEGDEAEAQRLCRALLADAPRTDEALEARLLLADLQAKTAPPREVMERLRLAYETEPLARSQRGKLAKRLGDLARTQGSCAEAIAWYEEAAGLLPALGSEASYRAASCYEEAGDVELAMAWYRAIEQPPWRVRGQLAAAKLLERQGREAEAAAIYQQLAGEPIPEAELIRERLAALRGAQR